MITKISNDLLFADKLHVIGIPTWHYWSYHTWLQASAWGSSIIFFIDMRLLLAYLCVCILCLYVCALLYWSARVSDLNMTTVM